MKFCAISDQHGALDFEVPPCDVLLVGGDNSYDVFGRGLQRMIGSEEQKQAQRQWFLTAYMPWLRRQPARVKLVTFGNHCSSAELIDTVEGAEIVKDRTVTVEGVSIWMSPWSNIFMSWFNMKTPAECAEIYAQIPAGTDILVSHQPPYGYGDYSVMANPDGDHHVGSKELLAAMDRVQPKVVIGGHIHGGFGHRTRSRQDGDTLHIYNVSVVNEAYQRVNPVTEFDL